MPWWRYGFQFSIAVYFTKPFDGKVELQSDRRTYIFNPTLWFYYVEIIPKWRNITKKAGWIIRKLLFSFVYL